MPENEVTPDAQSPSVQFFSPGNGDELQGEFRRGLWSGIAICSMLSGIELSEAEVAAYAAKAFAICGNSQSTVKPE